jgi:AhpD family alkylhydroperoxidase
MKRAEEFGAERKRLQELLEAFAGREMKRFLSLDRQVYREGALPARTKELLGLVASLVLRCDDCISYHVLQCRDAGVSTAELEEALAVALVVGGSICIPHLRRAVALWDEVGSG